MDIRVYLAGEIHSNWRSEIVEGCSSAQLPISFMSPISDHELSDGVGTDILGDETDGFRSWLVESRCAGMRLGGFGGGF